MVFCTYRSNENEGKYIELFRMVSFCSLTVNAAGVCLMSAFLRTSCQAPASHAMYTVQSLGNCTVFRSATSGAIDAGESAQFCKAIPPDVKSL